MTSQDLDSLRLELSVRAKNGLDFILAASLVWLGIAYVWTLPVPPGRRAFITFFVGALTLPLARLFSALLRTTWTLPHNPLQPLGLWLNFAQLFYFPFLLFIYGQYPAYFIMTYAIITGAHFFPYAWFYRAWPYAAAAGLIALGSLLLGVRTATSAPYAVPLFVVASLLLLALLLLSNYRQHQRLRSISDSAY